MRRAISLLGIVALAACKNATDPSYGISGHWIGDDISYPVNLDLNVKEAKSGTLSGGGSIYGTGISGTGIIAVTLSGSHSASTVTLVISATGYQASTYTGTLSNDTTVDGTLSGSGFSSYELVMFKHAH
jgi:uncharacterized protein (AIM24 family)